MKTYYFFIPKHKCNDKIESTNKKSAIIALKRKLGLTWLDDVKCLGINL